MGTVDTSNFRAITRNSSASHQVTSGRLSTFCHRLHFFASFVKPNIFSDIFCWFCHGLTDFLTKVENCQRAQEKMQARRRDLFAKQLRRAARQKQHNSSSATVEILPISYLHPPLLFITNKHSHHCRFSCTRDERQRNGDAENQQRAAS